MYIKYQLKPPLMFATNSKNLLFSSCMFWVFFMGVHSPKAFFL